MHVLELRTNRTEDDNAPSTRILFFGKYRECAVVRDTEIKGIVQSQMLLGECVDSKPTMSNGDEMVKFVATNLQTPLEVHCHFVIKPYK